MTEDELRTEALKMGFKLVKIPNYQCSCYCKYPNENCRFKNGHWKCVDKYEPVEFKQKWKFGPITHCRLKEGKDGVI